MGKDRDALTAKVSRMTTSIQSLEEQLAAAKAESNALVWLTGALDVHTGTH